LFPGSNVCSDYSSCSLLYVVFFTCFLQTFFRLRAHCVNVVTVRKLSFSSDHRFIHGCDGSKQYDPSTATPSSSGPLRAFLCSFSGCTGAESIKIVCPHCERNYCLKHRHADEHSCDAAPEKAPKPRPQVKVPVVEPSAIPEIAAMKAKSAVNPNSFASFHILRNSCLQPMNPADQKKMDKILIMKLKMNAKATADVPSEERIFLFVEGDELNGRQAVVVSKKWTVGRCASAIKKLLSLDDSKVLVHRTSASNFLNALVTIIEGVAKVPSAQFFWLG
ncbi:hypothetical protein ANCDUO_24820, partial [Ancylostoma duodenale]